jgi:hypothetical protein
VVLVGVSLILLRMAQSIRSNMGILLAFAPFFAFAIIDRIIGAAEGLTAGACVALGLLVRDWLTPERTFKVLEVGTAILFTALALYACFGTPRWSVIGVRLCVDAGLLIIVLGSMVLGRACTLQYARESVPVAVQQTPEFLRVNYLITAAWAIAFAAMVVAEFCLLYVPGFPHRAGIIVIVVALVAAVKFTGWYPSRSRT